MCQEKGFEILARLLFLALVIGACTSRPPAFDRSVVLVEIAFSPGGDGPVMSGLVVTDSHKLIYALGGNKRWSSIGDAAETIKLMEFAGRLVDYAAARYEGSGTGNQEISITFRGSTVTYGGETVPEILRTFLVEVDSVFGSAFGRKYQPILGSTSW